MGATSRQRPVAFLLLAILRRLQCGSQDLIVTLTSANFERHIREHKQTLVNFYAPWCGHCKELAPEYRKVAARLQELGAIVSLAKLDATKETSLSEHYKVQSYPTLLWFQHGDASPYDGERTAEAIEKWIAKMVASPVEEVKSPPSMYDAVFPQIVLRATMPMPCFERVASQSKYRRSVSWYFVRAEEGAQSQIALQHPGEEPVEMSLSSTGEQTRCIEDVEEFIAKHEFALVGMLNDKRVLERYARSAKGLVWAFLPASKASRHQSPEVLASLLPELRTLARGLQERYLVGYTLDADVDADGEGTSASASLGIWQLPAVLVASPANKAKKFLYKGNITANGLSKFITSVDANRAKPFIKSRPEPKVNNGPVRVVVGSTLIQEVFTDNKDVLLEIYAPWCGHCQKLDPEYRKLASRVRSRGLSQFVSVTKMDGTANESPIETLRWEGYPTIFLAKAGMDVPQQYKGERTAEALWNFLVEEAANTYEIKDELEKQGKTSDWEHLGEEQGVEDDWDDLDEDDDEIEAEL